MLKHKFSIITLTAVNLATERLQRVWTPAFQSKFFTNFIDGVKILA
jgi:hypothetical protein